MRRIGFARWTATLALCGCVLAAESPVAQAAQKMPITTSSKKALESYLKGRELVENLRAQESRQYFQSAVDEDPGFAVAHLQLAGVQPSAKAFFESIQRAKDLADDVSEAERLWILGFVAGAVEGDPMSQRDMFRELADTYPDDERALSLLAGNYFGQQEWELAVETHRRTAGINPDFAPLYNQLGYALRFLGRYDEAEVVFKKYMALIPTDPNPLDSYAELLMKMGRHEESIEQYRAALAIKPDFIFSHSGIATNLNFLGRYEEARAELRQMYSEAKDDGWRRTALTATALSFIDEGDFDRGVEQYEKQYALAAAIGDTSAMAGDLVLMGFALVEVEGREKEALAKFERATKMVQASSLPEGTRALNRLGFLFNSSRAYVAMGDVDNARAQAEEYRARIEAGGNQLQGKASHQLFGLIALEERKYALAVEELGQANQQNPYILFFIGEAYAGSGDRARAREFYGKAAHFNGLNSSPQACIRLLAGERLGSL